MRPNGGDGTKAWTIIDHRAEPANTHTQSHTYIQRHTSIERHRVFSCANGHSVSRRSISIG